MEVNLNIMKLILIVTIFTLQTGTCDRSCDEKGCSIEYCDNILEYLTPEYNNELEAGIHFGIHSNLIEDYNDKWEIRLEFYQEVVNIKVLHFHIFHTYETSPGVIARDDKIHFFITRRKRSILHSFQNILIEKKQNMEFLLTGQWRDWINIAPDMDGEVIFISLVFTAEYLKKSYTELIKVKFNAFEICQGTYRCGISYSLKEFANRQNIEPGEFPWLAVISDKSNIEKSFLCIGSLISDQHILTIASCVRDKQSGDLVIYLGKHNQESVTEVGIEKYIQSFNVEDIITHPDFRRMVNGKRLNDADIAVLKLDKPAILNNNVRPVCINFAKDPFVSRKTTGIAVGWVMNEDVDSFGGFPKKVNMPIVTLDECRKDDKRFLNITSERTICAGLKNGSGPCSGDGGAGLFVKNKLPGDHRIRYHISGLASKSLKTIDYGCDLSHYVIYTNITSFTTWLQNIVRPLVLISSNKNITSVSNRLEACDVYLTYNIPRGSNELNAKFNFSINADEEPFNGDTWKIMLSFSQVVLDFSTLDGEIILNRLERNMEQRNDPITTIKLASHVTKIDDYTYIIKGYWTGRKINSNNRKTFITVPFVAKYLRRSFTELTKVKFNNKFICNGKYSCGITNKSIETFVKRQNAEQGEFPWLAAIYKNSKIRTNFLCSGSLISDQFVLLTAHTIFREDINELLVVLGKSKLDSASITDQNSQIFNVKNYFIHPDFKKISPRLRDADIAVLKLETKVEINDNVRPICINLRVDHYPPPGANGIIAGWGMRDTIEEFGGSLKKIRVPIVSLDECRKDNIRFFEITAERTFCAGKRNGEGPCTLDGGGGLYTRFKLPGDNRIRYQIDGIISRSLISTDPTKDCDLSHFTVYTNIHKFKNWLQDIGVPLNIDQHWSENYKPNTITQEVCDVYLLRLIPNSANELNAVFSFPIDTSHVKSNNLWDITLSFSNPLTNFSTHEEIEVYIKKEAFDNNTMDNVITKTPLAKLKVKTTKKLSDKTFKLYGVWDKNYESTEIVNIDVPFVAEYPAGFFTDLVNVDYNNQEICEGTYNCGYSSGSIESIAAGQAVQSKEFPWLAAIFSKSKAEKRFVCGGSLITDQLVLTAAHCEKGVEDRYLKVILGKYELLENEVTSQEFNIKEFIIHDDYFLRKQTPNIPHADIAVIILDRKVELNEFVRPVCLHFRNVPPPPNTKGTVVGWGLNESGNVSGFPKKINLPIVPLDECRKDDHRFMKLTSERTFCAGLKNGSGPCSGDSGGGFYSAFQLPGDSRIRYHIEGIVSTALKPKNKDSILQCDLNHYTIYTDVYSFRYWLRDVIGAHISFRNTNK